jgi:hypothetical protein
MSKPGHSQLKRLDHVIARIIEGVGNYRQEYKHRDREDQEEAIRELEGIADQLGVSLDCWVD